RALQEVLEGGHELRLLLALERRPVPGERSPGDLVEIEHLANDRADLARSTGGAVGIVGSAVLDVHEAADRRFDGVTRSHGRQGRCGLGYEQQGCRKRNQDPGRHRCPSYMTLRPAGRTPYREDP